MNNFGSKTLNKRIHGFERLGIRMFESMYVDFHQFSLAHDLLEEVGLTNKASIHIGLAWSWIRILVVEGVQI
jgi:hypothetical protein